MWHKPGAGDQQHGANRSDTDAHAADTQGPPCQDLRHALGFRLEVCSVVRLGFICRVLDVINYHMQSTLVQGQIHSKRHSFFIICVFCNLPNLSVYRPHFLLSKFGSKKFWFGLYVKLVKITMYIWKLTSEQSTCGIGNSN